MFLMHKDVPVADVKMMDGKIIGVLDVFCMDRMPAGTISVHKQLLPALLSNWQSMRAIPEERMELGRIERALGCTVSEALIKSMAVSLTDCYWYKENNSPLTWADVNYHDNGFTTDLANIIYCTDSTPVIQFKSPDYTTDGILPKAWCSMDGVPVLIKRGNLGRETGKKNLLSANEVVAYRIAKKMEINHVPYFPVSIEGTGEVVCGCPCFIKNADIEFVNALQIAKDNQAYTKELYQHFAKAGMQQDINKMLLLDHIIHNTDRHEKNFGILRNADTMETIGMAPLFDSGSCLRWNDEMVFTKPFAQKREEQIGLLQSLPCDVPDPGQVKEIIQDAYESFCIPEKVFDIACSDVDTSYDMLATKELLSMERKENEEDLEL